MINDDINNNQENRNRKSGVNGENIKNIKDKYYKKPYKKKALYKNNRKNNTFLDFLY